MVNMYDYHLANSITREKRHRKVNVCSTYQISALYASQYSTAEDETLSDKLLVKLITYEHEQKL